jgi:hypothetical protein
MAIELQIESRALGDITTRALQSQLSSTCFWVRFNGPIGAVQAAGNWALASTGRVRSIYRVSHSPDAVRPRVECSCVSV